MFALRPYTHPDFSQEPFVSAPDARFEAVEKDGVMVPKLKVSENVGKITNPGFKTVWRLYERGTNKAIADVMTLFDEVIDDSQPYVIFDPVNTWKKKTVTDFVARRLPVQIFRKGECCYECPAIGDVRVYCAQQVGTLWDEVKRFENPHAYYVDLSQKLWDIKRELLDKYSV